MKKVKINKSLGETYFIKERGISKGCQQCLNGEKLVLFINGICQKPEHCSWYCPISKERRGKDLTFANEIQITSKKDLLEEINKTDALGMSVTGGEPLSKLNFEKTLDYIQYVKSKKGKDFHIHLYTNGQDFNESIAEQLAQADLDEIRFHPAKKNWNALEKALNKGISVGVEVPLIPDREYIEDLEELIIYLDKIGAEFINLNEFEICYPNSNDLKTRGYKLKKGTTASVENSKEMGIALVERISKKVSLKIHFCTVIAKDYHQLRNRYLRRAKNIKLPYEVINDDGLLLYGQIEGDKKNILILSQYLLSELKISSEVLSIEKDKIKLPYYIAIKDELIKFLDNYHLKGYILEVLPFRREIYRQITEKTPIKVFLQEAGIYEN